MSELRELLSTMVYMLDMKLPPSTMLVPPFDIFFIHGSAIYSFRDGAWERVSNIMESGSVERVAYKNDMLCANKSISVEQLRHYQSDIMAQLQDCLKGDEPPLMQNGFAESLLHHLDDAVECHTWVRPKSSNELYGLSPLHGWVRVPYVEALMRDVPNTVGKYFIVYNNDQSEAGDVNACIKSFLEFYNNLR